MLRLETSCTGGQNDCSDLFKINRNPLNNFKIMNEVLVSSDGQQGRRNKFKSKNQLERRIYPERG